MPMIWWASLNFLDYCSVSVLFVGPDSRNAHPVVKRADVNSEPESNNNANERQPLVNGMPSDPVAESQYENAEGEQPDETENHYHGMGLSRDVSLARY
jgi:hypothetical protein